MLQLIWYSKNDPLCKGILNFELLIATPPMMPKLAKLGQRRRPVGSMIIEQLGDTVEDLATEIAGAAAPLRQPAARRALSHRIGKDKGGMPPKL